MSLAENTEAQRWKGSKLKAEGSKLKAEGKGRFSKKEFVQYLYISRGSLYETMTLLVVFRRKKWISDDRYFQIESGAKEIASMIKGLINSISNG
ncbi:MAG: four helix bundle protein [Deltaproteobacteria bacterium]|nr:four helix bundle protein [Deltaproteobacteria bacterium]